MSDIIEEAKISLRIISMCTERNREIAVSDAMDAEKRIERLVTECDRLTKELAKAREVDRAAKALADKVDATTECDHKRASCEEIGCIGFEVKTLRAALAAKETP